MFESLAAAVIRRPWRTSIATLLVVAVFLTGLANLQVDLSFRSFYGRDDPANRTYDAFREFWGADDDLVLVVVHADGADLLEPDRARALAGLGRTLEALPVVRSVTSVATAASVIGTSPGEFDLDPLMDAMPAERGPAWEAWRARVLASRILVPTLISEDGRTAALLVETRHETSRMDEIRPIVASVQEVATAWEGRQGLRIGLAGVPAVRAAFFHQFVRNQSIFAPASLLIMLLCLFAVFRRAHGVWIPAVAATVPLAMVFGLMGWFGQPIGVLSQTFTTLLPALAVADAIHLVSRYHERLRVHAGTAVPTHDQRVRAAREAATHIGRACLITSITTGVGFLSLTLANMPILRIYGLFAATGVVLAYLGVLFAVPVWLVWSKAPAPPAGDRAAPTWADRVLLACANFGLSRPYVVLGVTGALVLGAVGFGWGVVVDNQLTRTLSPDHPVTQANVRADRELGGILGLEVDLKGEPGALKDPAVLAALLGFEDWALERPDVRQATSPATWVALLHQATTGVRQAPQSREAAAQFFLFAESDPAFTRMIDGDYSRARMWLTLRDRGGVAFRAEAELLGLELERRLADLPVAANLTGSPYVAYRGVNGVTADLRRSLAFAFVVITAIVGLLFRDWRTGLLCLIPNGLPLVLGYGLIGLMGWQLNPTPAVIFTIALGIAVDDTLHLVIRIREEQQGGMGLEAAVRHAVLHSGRAVAITSFILCVGFGINALSSFETLQILGWLGGVVIATALLSDLFLLPALFALWGPRSVAVPGSARVVEPLLVPMGAPARAVLVASGDADARRSGGGS